MNLTRKELLKFARDEFLTTSEISELCEKDMRTVQRWIKAGKLTSPVSGSKAYLRTDVEAQFDIKRTSAYTQDQARHMAQAYFVSYKDTATAQDITIRRIQKLVQDARLEAIKEGTQLLLKTEVKEVFEVIEDRRTRYGMGPKRS